MTEQTNNDNNPTSVMLIDIGMTRQPRQYQSVRVGVTLPVFVAPGDDVHTLLVTNLAKAKHELEETVDLEFEAYGEPAVYSQEPRFMLLLVPEDRLAAIVPNMAQKDLPGAWAHAGLDYKKHRLSYVRQQAASEWSHCRLVDCSDGDLSQLPPLGRFELHQNVELGWSVLTLSGVRFAQRESGYWRSYYQTRLLDALAAELTAKAAAENTKFFDCTDGDFAKLPPLPQPKDETDDDVSFDDDAREDNPDED